MDNELGDEVVGGIGGVGDGEDDLLGRLVEELDDTNAILERVRRRGVPEELAHQLQPRSTGYGGAEWPPPQRN